MANPIEFLCLAIDPAKKSGWAWARNAQDTIETGSVTTAYERLEVCERTLALQEELQLPLVVTAEKWPGRWRSWASAVGTGKAYGRWLDHIEFVLKTKEQHILRVNTQRWRNALFGHMMSEGDPKTPEELKRLACAYIGTKDFDAAEAGCMAIWTHSSVEGQEAAEKALRRLRRSRK